MAKIFVAIISGQYNYGSEKSWKTQGIFFSYIVATLLLFLVPPWPRLE